jgi:hypothetical protein
MNSRNVTTLAVLALLALCGTGARALERGTADGGITYVSGGIGQSELKELHAERKRYNLWVATLAKGSGAYLSDARLHITGEPGQRVVLDHTMAGPWFFATLPAGRYEISATKRGAGGADETQTLRVTVRAGVLRQAVLRFTSDADVGPEREHPFGANPFGASSPKQ